MLNAAIAAVQAPVLALAVPCCSQELSPVGRWALTGGVPELYQIFAHMDLMTCEAGILKIAKNVKFSNALWCPPPPPASAEIPVRQILLSFGSGRSNWMV